MRIVRLAAALIFATGLGCCTAAAAPPGADVVRKAATEYIIPAYQRVLDATSALTGAMGRYCISAGDDERAALSAAFAQTVSAWAAIDFLRFGPMGTEARFEKFAFWPDPHGTGTRQIRQLLAKEDPEILALGVLQRQSAAVQGLLALEALLYSGDDALFGADGSSEFRCQLALAIARNMNAIAALASFGWAGESGFLQTMLSPGQENLYYATDAEPLTELLRAILTGIEQDRDLKILPTLGASPSEAKPRRAPFAASGLTTPYLRDSLAAMKSFIDLSGLFSLLPESDRDLKTTYEELFATSQSELEAAGPDFPAALADPAKRTHLANTTSALAGLRDLFHFSVAPKLGISSGFNALDGD